MFVSSTQVSKEGKVGKAQYNDVSYLLKLVSTKVGIILPEGRFQGGGLPEEIHLFRLYYPPPCHIFILL